VAAVVTVAAVARHGASILIALAVLMGAFLLSVLVLVPMRRRRVRTERKPE